MSSERPAIDYTQVVKDAGIPVTADEMKAEWNQINANQGSLISNDSKWSAFWQLITAIVTTPMQWLVNFLIQTLLPNSYIATATGSFLDNLAWGVNLTRKASVTMTGNITFNRSSSADALTIPAGTVVQTPPINGIVYRVTTIADAILQPGIDTLDVLCQAENAGADWNLASGYYSLLPAPVPGIDSVRNNDGYIVTPGADAESDNDLQLRCQNQFTAVGDYHNDAVYIQVISSFAGISPDYIYIEHGAPRGPGSANAYIMIDSGVPDQTFIDSINFHVRDEGYHGLGDDMLCYPMPTQSFDISPTVWLDETLTNDEQNLLLSDITDMINCAFRNNAAYDGQVTKTFPNSRFSFSVLGEELHLTFVGLKSIEFNHGDIDEIGSIKLPVIGTLAVTKGTQSP